MTATLILSPDQQSYTTEDNPSVISTQLDGGASRSRRDVLNPSSFVTVQWTTDTLGYRYLRQFYRQEADEGATPFWCRLILDDSQLDIYLCKFVPASMALGEATGQIRVVTAKLEVTPIPVVTADTDFLTAYPFTIPRVNWFTNSSFETDTDVNGLANDYSSYNFGSAGTVTYVMSTSHFEGARCQQVNSTALGSSVNDRMGAMQRVALPNNSILDGKRITASVYMLRAIGPGSGRVFFQFNDDSDAFISASDMTADVLAGGFVWQRVVNVATVPAGTQYIYVYMWMQEGGAIAGRVLLDAAQLELGDGATEFIPTKAA